MLRSYLLLSLAVIGLNTFALQRASAQGVIPGTGTLIDYVGDTFEDADWQFVNHYPKSSRENDDRLRSPTGYSANRRWFEGPERGQPDLLKVIPTPAGGVPGSEYALLMRTLHSGIPGRNSYDVQQDDLIVDCVSRLGTGISPSELPNCVARVYLPPVDQWEKRSGPQFGFRLGLMAKNQKSSGGVFSRHTTEVEPYWPGMWIHFRSKTSRGVEEESALIKVRGNTLGRDFHVKDISQDQFGWWTLGMSVTADGMIHYYASPGVDPLTANDYLTSQYPYGFRALQFRTFFFDVCNRNDGTTWSTPFVVDDAELYVVKATRINSIVEQKKKLAQQRAMAQRNRSTQSSNRR